ncbi:ABC transporter permease [Carboxylicivirga sediminis]|uniref:ABC transporter permease n=1 Tax=Carboxylicivirga sediminis TaxID=2006564 RepID=A0A941IWY7_9BACT|nr:ABC transporter permease [Carboxylicivirga sediminis]MBR8535018.1 ABC transporter permease [Carboxylicivirga sediminis]
MQHAIKLALRKLFVKGQYTFTRTISLAVGLAFGMLILSEVFYYYSYDGFYPDADRIYTVQSSFKRDKEAGEFENYSKVSGAIAPGIKAEVPGVEAATRLNSIGTHLVYDQLKRGYKAEVVLADEHWGDVVPRPMISGHPAKILASPMACMVSSELAEAMGGDVIGQVIELKRYPGKQLTIQGVFEALPENTNYNYDILVSMVSITEFFSWDGSTNWLGNDRYMAYVKLQPGINPNDLAPALRKMQQKHQDIERLEEEQGGLVLKYVLKPIKCIYKNNHKDMLVILSTIALAVLFVSLMNYFLLTLSILVNRAKSSAIYKTCGAQVNNIRQLIFVESLTLFVLALTLASLLLWVFKPFAEAQLGHSLTASVNPGVLWPLMGVLAIWLVLMSYLPARYFSRIPVATAFRSYRQKKNNWKLGLLALQLVGASFILTLMVIVTLQYEQMRKADHGYDTEGIYYGATTAMNGSQVQMIINELNAMAEVEQVSLGYSVPIRYASGNNVLSPGGHRELFNVADFYEVDEHYFSMLGIPIIQGHSFANEMASTNNVMISQKAADLLEVYNNWTDGVTGKPLTITEHGATTIQGIYPDFVIGPLSRPDDRPSVFFYKPQHLFIQEKNEHPFMSMTILVKVHSTTQAGMKDKIAAVFNKVLPQKDAEVKSLAEEQLISYADEKGFRNAMLAGNFVILLITIIGLIGYTTNEATRRQKELAIRRINGAKMSNLVQYFVMELQYMAIPAVMFGLVGAWYTASKWMQNFAYKIPLNWMLFLMCSFIILLTVAAVAVVNYLRIGNRNPVEALRYE